LYCIYSKGEFIFEKHIYLQEHKLMHRKGFISLAIKTDIISNDAFLDNN
jgi:hypothetical protein